LKKLAFLLAVLAAPCFASDVAGTLKGKVGDRDVELAILADQSDFDLYGTGKLAGSVSLGTENVDEASGLRTMLLSLESMDLKASVINNADAVIMTPETSPPIVMKTRLEDGLEITVTQAELVGEKLHVAGTARGTLAAENIITHAPADHEPIVLDLSFDALLDPLAD